ncbi:HD domain-containing phosphohydrolase [Bacillus alveayuensis]|jgi:anti-sigma regulatory factor (Ser/Thr protein kinase)|uniref:HD domain-containing phosphohydrolase n=1 Tax=Aeribacillus alveayuensis TaxID=279215 RepID=UPI0009FBC747|nr:HD domain-containing phosphohydrolase [Bacillus alveayuensis]
MKEKNWYTWSLFIIGSSSTLYMFFHILNVNQWIELLIILLFLIFLDIFPIKLPSGDFYNAGTICFLYILFEFDWTAGVLAFFLSTLTYNLTVFPFQQIFQSIYWFRFFVTVGMYSTCGFVTELMIGATERLPFILRIFLAICTFEFTNQLLYSGILRTALGVPIFHNFKAKLQEYVIPILGAIVVLPKLLSPQNVQELAIEVLYASFFLAIIIFFSKKYIEQTFLRQDMSREIVRLLESRIASRITGHGTRVGAICEALLETFEYPKHRRSDLVQIAIMHDIGKSFLPSYVFEKRGALTLSEEKEYKSHCQKGADIIKAIYPKGPFADWVLHHHERWDGKGFPQGLKGESIPLESRILAICNQLDHLMMRHQNDATVYQLLQELAGTALDPHLVQKIDVDLIAEIRAAVGFKDYVAKQEESTALEIDRNVEEKQHIGESVLLRYTDRLINDTNLQLPEEKISELARFSKESAQKFHEFIELTDKTYEAYFSPYDKEVFIFVHDLTPMLEFKKKTMLQILQSYQDVIRTLSNNKIHLYVQEQELFDDLGDYIASMPINNVNDVPRSRAFVSQYLSNYHIVKSKMQVLLAVSEATTNLVKHATEGEISVFFKNNLFQVLITDKGSGIPLHELPKTILVSGYSSKRSLGKGFSLMSTFSERVAVYTSSEGTKILLEFACQPNVKNNDSEQENNHNVFNTLTS